MKYQPCVLYICRPSDDNPLVTDKEIFEVTVDAPDNTNRFTDVRVPTSVDNVDTYEVFVRQPNGKLVPVTDGKVRLY